MVDVGDDRDIAQGAGHQKGFRKGAALTGRVLWGLAHVLPAIRVCVLPGRAIAYHRRERSVGRAHTFLCAMRQVGVFAQRFTAPAERLATGGQSWPIRDGLALPDAKRGEFPWNGC
jgi:hypothetical protein